MTMKYVYRNVLRRPSTAIPWFEDYLASSGQTTKLATFTKKTNDFTNLLKMSPSYKIMSTDLEITVDAEFTETEFYAIFKENESSLTAEEKSVYQEFLAYNKNNGMYNLSTMSELLNNAPLDPNAPYLWFESTDEELRQQFRNQRWYAFSTEES